jgi:hypothetical protein
MEALIVIALLFALLTFGEIEKNAHDREASLVTAKASS